MLAPGCFDAAGDFLYGRIVMNELFGMVFAGLASIQHEIATVNSNILEDRDNVAQTLDSLRNEIHTNKSEFDSLASNFDSHDLKTELGWLKKRVPEERVRIIPNSESFSRAELLACYSAKRMAAITGIKFIKSITIPAVVESIGEKCFYECTNLVSVRFVPGSCLRAIGKEAFCGCKKLQEIEIPDKVESLGEYCFYQCAALQSINIPNSVTSLGDDCFYGCRTLRSVSLPAQTRIGKECFANCHPNLQITKR